MAWASGKWRDIVYAVVTVVVLVLVLAFALDPLREKLGNFLAALFLIILLSVAAWTVVIRKFDVPSWREENRERALIAVVLITTFVGGIYLVGAISTFADPKLQPSAYRAVSLWALAYCAAGFLVGFLFGIPRVLQGEDVLPGQQPEYRQRVNTNLEQISDWLTKIIVGLGLVELRQCRITFTRLPHGWRKALA